MLYKHRPQSKWSTSIDHGVKSCIKYYFEAIKWGVSFMMNKPQANNKLEG